MRLEKKTAIVTGGGSGFGAAIVEKFIQEGARVVVADINLSGAEAVASQFGDMAMAVKTNVAEAASIMAMKESAVKTFGSIDIVINNAGILRDVIFHKMDPKDWTDVIDVHLNGSFYISRAAAPFFREQNSGSFVHMTSTSGLIGNFGQANYSAAKLGIAGLSKSISLDMKRFNVRSNCIAPFAWSRMTNSIPSTTEQEKARVERLKKMTPETNAPLAVYLSSEDAKDITGQIFSSRLNELFIYNQNRPVKSVHNSEGWNPQKIMEIAMPAFKPYLTPLERSGDIFSWDPL